MMIEKKIKKNYDLTDANTFRLSGCAEFFLSVKNKNELRSAARWAKEKKMPLSVLGGGSNVIIKQKKIKGLVIKITGAAYSVKKRNVKSWSGTSLTGLSKIAERSGLTGLEWANGIPGTIGGAVRGNAGAYGFSLSDSAVEVEVYDRSRDKFIKLDKAACGFSYRHSIFKKRKDLVIIGVKLELAKGKMGEIKKLGGQNLALRLAAKPKEPSAGCIFKNLEFNKLVRINKPLAEGLAAKGLVRAGKIGVGCLIDQLNLKGKTMGRAKVSLKHANFIINNGGAKAGDVVGLIKLIKQKIKNRYKIDLEEEVQYF
ncbi:MAG: UDP-N-acetylmuramate dehydrogenase [bacterium]|nr:UDP-N-acetylmuramate dehydrogenase [bacterium]